MLALVTDVKEARQWVKLCGERGPVLAEVELHIFRGATLFVEHEDGVPRTYNVTRFGKRKKNAWEPYANWYTAYTPTAYRRRGYARQLADQVKHMAVTHGCVRLKALAGTRLGLLLHIGLGDELWGVTEKAEVVVDTPLTTNPAYAGRTPPNGTADAGTEPWTLTRVDLALNGREMRYDALCKKKSAGK